jgi:MFS family permease
MTRRGKDSTGLYSAYVVGILCLAYTLAFVDRQVLSLLVGPIKADLGISDVQFSLLQGMSFAIFYTFLGLLIARLADSHNRKIIIAICVLLWSVMTAACGFAGSFAVLLLCRVGVGVGEGGLSPAAYSLIADQVRKERLGRALGIYSIGLAAGAGIALIFGGYAVMKLSAMKFSLWPLSVMHPWQQVFLLVGTPGVLVGLLVLTIREPGRGGKIIGDKSLKAGAVLDYLRYNSTALTYLFLSVALLSAVANGILAWAPAYFMREHGWTIAQVGRRLGLVILFGGTLGTVAGGAICDLWKRKGSSAAPIAVVILAGVMMLVFGILAPLITDAWLSLAAFVPLVAFMLMPWGVAGAAVQMIAPNELRAQLSSAYLFAINLFGLGLGPTVVAFVSEKLFAGQPHALAMGIAITTGVFTPIALVFLFLLLAPFRRAADNPTAWFDEPLDTGVSAMR